MENTNTPLGAPPENNLIWAILSTVLCCWPVGIYAIIRASKVKELWYKGDHIGAQKAADDAKKWSIISVVSYFGFFIVVLIFALLIGALESM